MAETAHSTRVPAKSNKLTRRAALGALPAISGVALLASIDQARAETEVDAAIKAALEAREAERISCEAMTKVWQDSRLKGHPRVLNYTVKAGDVESPVYAYSIDELERHWGPLVNFWGPDSKPAQILAEKRRELDAAWKAREKIEAEIGFTALQEEGERLGFINDAATERLLDAPVTTLDEARRKIAAFAEVVMDGFMESEAEARAILLRLI